MPEFALPLSKRSDVQAAVSGSGTVGTFGTFTVAGLAQYQRYLPTTTSGSQIDYGSGVSTLPIRRAIVQVMSGTTPIATGYTDDSGNYSVPTTVTTGATIFVRIQARSTVTGYSKDGLGGASAENCAGGGWDIRVVNNVTGSASSQTDATLRPQYALDSSTFSAPANGTQTVNMTASMAFNGTTYTARSGAPFALLDTAISAIETACQGRAAITFPTVYMNWSADNTTASGNRYEGNISTSFFTTETTAKTANLYILGKENTDTDELDNHVVAHEFGHFLENKIYRSDSIGGAHSLGDSLDPRLAFGEGFGNAFSGIVHSDPVYIDTSGSLQGTGFNIDVSTAPSSNSDRGPWSERAMQYMLYHFWQQRGSFDRIHNVLENYQKTSDASTNGLTFVAYYAQNYGQTDDDLTTTWTNAGILASPINGLCTGSCGAATPVYSPFDVDNDLGFAYTVNRNYKQTGGSSFAAPFWQMYRPLVSGTNAATTHDQISLGGYTLTSANLNKFGMHRLYTVTATSSTTTVSIPSLTQSGRTCSNGDYLDLAVYGKGVLLGADEATSGATASCPTVTFCSTPGQTYIVDVIGFGTVGSYTLSVSP